MKTPTKNLVADDLSQTYGWTGSLSGDLILLG